MMTSTRGWGRRATLLKSLCFVDITFSTRISSLILSYECISTYDTKVVFGVRKTVWVCLINEILYSGPIDDQTTLFLEEVGGGGMIHVL